ncbi:MAG: hypothetical protein PHI97_06090 [Desulfobulbus sp.]|nr:hypothetical protein [Desulfobulbus sp.]
MARVKEIAKRRDRRASSMPKSRVTRLIQYAAYIAHCPRGGITWDAGFGYDCTTACAPLTVRAASATTGFAIG